MDKKGNLGMKVGIAAGVTAAVAAAAGAYWLYGAKHSAKHRQMAKSWMLKARADVMDAVEKIGEIDRAAYVRVVDEVMKRYAGVKGSTSAEVAKVVAELKNSWKHMQKAGKKVAKKTGSKKRVSSKKATRKAKSA